MLYFILVRWIGGAHENGLCGRQTNVAVIWLALNEQTGDIETGGFIRVSKNVPGAQLPGQN